MTSLCLFHSLVSTLSRMASRSETSKLLQRLFEKDVLDIHGVAEVLEMKRSSVNTLIVRPSSGFPEPFFELRGKQRHPLRLWWREDVEHWIDQRPSSKDPSRSRGGVR